MGIRSTVLALTTVVGLMSATAATAEDPAWAGKVKKLLAAKQTYPDAAQTKGDQGTAIVKLMIGPDGKLQSVELVKPSGSRVLDREAVTIPSKVGTFPAPGAASSLTVPLTWKLS
ncbi:energy transducer TonB [Sphingomonas sp. Leaf17]|uniref:energy transducer TonB n=1 Tax=Sphingomonas sp. Leaf17 TaxID=1735683 RepID=UPI0009E7F0BE|nr:energy transducer TonB [Sphingomonas sp. Leaf17]